MTYFHWMSPSSVVGPVMVQFSFAYYAVMFGGSGGSGGGDGVHGDGDAHGAAPWEPQALGSQGGKTPAPSPCLAALRAAGGAEESEGFWSGTGNHELWPLAVCCGYAAKGAGGDLKVETGAVDGTHPDLPDLQRCRHAVSLGRGDGGRGICWICLHRYSLHFPCRHL